MSSVPKIVIKPRLAGAPAPVLGTSSRLIKPATPTPELEDDGVEGDVEDGASAADENVQTGDEGGSRVGTPGPRARGRGRGRGRGATTGTGTPRARGRGRGRVRGRGRGALTIRLPSKKEEEGEGGTEGEGEGEIATPIEGESAEGAGEAEGDGVDPVKEKETPMGGGKPFRKIHGKIYVIDGDEFITDNDPKGDEKIDPSGNLLGGRRFKASTFVLPNRHPTRQYMLAIDAARTSGFRDSLYYFRRNLLAFKLNATQPEKDYLIAEGKLGSHLRTRSVTLITARSAFKLHGSKMVIDGKWVTDDYYEEKVTEEITPLGLKPGDPVGELPDPNAASHSNELSALAAASAANANKERASGGGGGVYRAGGPTTLFGSAGWGPYSDGPLNAVRKSLLSRDGVGEENWMYRMAARVVDAGEEWARWRRESMKAGGGPGAEGIMKSMMGISLLRVNGDANKRRDMEDAEDGEEELRGSAEAVEPTAKRRKVNFENDELPVGVYEPHSGLLLCRADTQPTESRWESLPDSRSKRRVLGGTKAGNGAWALAWVDTVMKLPRPDKQPSPGVQERERLWKEFSENEGVDHSTMVS